MFFFPFQFPSFYCFSICTNFTNDVVGCCNYSFFSLFNVSLESWYWCYLPNPSAREGYDTRSIFKRSLTGLNSEFFFSKTSCLTKAEEPSLSYYLPIAGGRIIGFIPFPRVLVLCEMQSVSSRFWTRVAVSIFYDDNHYTMGTSLVLMHLRNLQCWRFLFILLFLTHMDSQYHISAIES